MEEKGIAAEHHLCFGLLWIAILVHLERLQSMTDFALKNISLLPWQHSQNQLNTGPVAGGAQPNVSCQEGLIFDASNLLVALCLDLCVTWESLQSSLIIP